MVQHEIELVRRLTGVREDQITFCDDGFWSRGYLVDGGRIIFKFRKSPEVCYENEIRLLHHLNSLDLGVNLQRVGWQSEDGSCLGLYGVLGEPLETLALSDAQKKDAGRQAGAFLRQLHEAKPAGVPVCGLAEEISAWQRRFASGREILARYFTPAEMARLDAFMMEEGPMELEALGERLVFSHGDLGGGNVLVDESGAVGVIDFNESGFFEEAADFMDIMSDTVCAAMLNAYGADEVLRRKTAVRQALRPLFVAGTYAPRGEAAVQPYIRQIKAWLIGQANKYK